MARNNWVSLLDFQAVVSNNRSIIKTDGSGLTLLAMQPVLAVQPCSSQPNSSPSPGQQHKKLLGFVQGWVQWGWGKSQGLLWPESRAEQSTAVLVLCSKHAEKSKEIQVGFPQSSSAPFWLMVLIPWLIFSLETSKRKKKNKSQNKALWKFCCFSVKGIVF